MPYTIPMMPASTTYETWYAAGQTVAAIAGPVELGIGVFVAFLLIQAIMKTVGWQFDSHPDYGYPESAARESYEFWALEQGKLHMDEEGDLYADDPADLWD